MHSKHKNIIASHQEQNSVKRLHSGRSSVSVASDEERSWLRDSVCLFTSPSIWKEIFDQACNDSIKRAMMHQFCTDVERIGKPKWRNGADALKCMCAHLFYDDSDAFENYST